MEVGGSSLCIRCSRENGALVAVEDFQPAIDVGRAILGE